MRELDQIKKLLAQIVAKWESAPKIAPETLREHERFVAFLKAHDPSEELLERLGIE
jgi:hypothetical protein